MRPSFAIVTLLLLGAAGCAHTSKDTPVVITKTTKLTSDTRVAIPEAGFSLLIPAGWLVEDKEFNPGVEGLCFHPHFLGPNFFVDPMLSRGPEKSLQENMEKSLTRMKGLWPHARNWQELEKSEFNTPDISGVYCVFQFDQAHPGRPVRRVTYSRYYYRNGKGQIIQLRFQGDAKLARSIVDTLVLEHF